MPQFLIGAAILISFNLVFILLRYLTFYLRAQTEKKNPDWKKGLPHVPSEDAMKAEMMGRKPSSCENCDLSCSSCSMISDDFSKDYYRKSTKEEKKDALS